MFEAAVGSTVELRVKWFKVKGSEFRGYVSENQMDQRGLHLAKEDSSGKDHGQ